MDIRITPITATDKDIFLNLYNLYLYDLSSYTGEDVQEDGKYDIGTNGLYLEREELYPYLIRVGEQPAGFVLVCSPPFTPDNVDFTIQELFLLKKFRGKHVAEEAVMKVFERHPGTYCVEQLEHNLPAVGFWKKLYAKHGISYSSDKSFVEIDGLPGEFPLISQTFSIGK